MLQWARHFHYHQEIKSTNLNLSDATVIMARSETLPAGVALVSAFLVLREMGIRMGIRHRTCDELNIQTTIHCGDRQWEQLEDRKDVSMFASVKLELQSYMTQEPLDRFILSEFDTGIKSKSSLILELIYS